MLRMTSQIDTIVNAYKTLSKIPSIVGAKLNNDGNRISCKWSVRNLDKGKTTKYLHDYILNDNLKVISESEFGVDVSNELLSSVSPKGMFKALIREEKEGKDKKQYLEVWCRHNLAHCIDLTALDVHGDVYADSEFGSLDWSQDESALVYVAEKKLKKSEPYIKRKAEDKAKTDGSGESTPKRGEEYVYKQDWGEQLVGKHLSVVVMCKLATETVTVLEGLPETWCPGQVRFSPDGQSVVGVAWETEPRRLGLIFCTNRPSYIFKLTLDGNLSKITSEGLSVRSPRYSDGGELVWLQRNSEGPHHACHAIFAKKNDQTQIATVIDIIDTEMTTSNGEAFHGVYSQALPSRCFASGGRLVFSTPQKNEVRTYVVDIDGGRIVDISNKSFIGSTSVLDVKADIVLAACSNMTTPTQLFVARLPAKGSEMEIQWVQVTESCEVPASVARSDVKYIQLQHDTEDSVKSFTALYFAPSELDKKFPLIVWPHGGPHSAFVNAFSLEAALFNMLGFASLQINYRGSIGAGDASVRFLLKRVGDADVRDCKLATDEILKQYPVDSTKLCLFGGSHGGFLVTHLSGQYPDTYRVVVSRNPVVDVATMFNSTDIADWCAVEAGFLFTEKGPISEEELLAMRRCSPLAHVHRVKAPTALMLGSGDKRVPHYQGLEYSRRLKANGVPTKVYMYEDNHSLSSLPAEMDNLINSADWFLTHLNKSD
ncbi:acylamino-acid-releasing enzyme-like [Papilio machaon]|uniref:acylamino-acid-releasing enzyme-like n=1 Tax=Papilio machaon TaxID=76193 RepID=UPI001E664C60|nr:acylamino-acid-releasing enzyme-like [Papilio machaon]XP_045535568.1 acylamino-acid-releasing enzyme-like [Papilio machaon]